MAARRFTVLATPAKTAIAARCVVSTPSILGRRYASAAAAVKEVEAEEKERVLPELREKDLVTLRRQRNIGVSAHIDSGEFSGFDFVCSVVRREEWSVGILGMAMLCVLQCRACVWISPRAATARRLAF